MKIFSVLLAAFFIGGNCFAGEFDIANSTKATIGHYSLRHPKKGVRTDGKPGKTDIKPVAQASGISTGLVVIYGHVVKPPYKISVNADVISINSVPVGEMATEKGVLSAKAGDLLEQANILFCDAVRKKASDGNVGDILALFQKNTDVVVSAKWLKNEPPPKGVLIVNWKGSVRRPDVHFSAGSCRTQTSAVTKIKNNTASANLTDSARQAVGLQKALEQGNMLFFTTEGHSDVLPISCKKQILEVLEDETTTRKELIVKLEKVGLSHHAALDTLRNFIAKEWAQ